MANGHHAAAADLFGGQEIKVTPEQTAFVELVNELQTKMSDTMDCAKRVAEAASKIVLSMNLPEKDKKPHAIKIALTYFDKLHRRKFTNPDTGQPIPATFNGGRDSALMKRLLDTHGSGHVTDLIDQFFAIDDEWIRKTGYTVPAFSNRVPSLIAAQSPTRTHGVTAKTANNRQYAQQAADMIRRSYNG